MTNVRRSLRTRRLAQSAGIIAFIVLRAADGRAQQVWTETETKIHVTDGDYGLPEHVRGATEARFSGEGVGVDYLLFRIGPVWTIGTHFHIGANGVAVTEKTGEKYRPDARAELEPHLFLQIGSLHLDDRNRGESRWFPSENAWRYSNQLRFTYEPERAVWIPVLSQEGLFSIDTGKISESRTAAGVVWRSPSPAGLSGGVPYLLRLARDDGWSRAAHRTARTRAHPKRAARLGARCPMSRRLLGEARRSIGAIPRLNRLRVYKYGGALSTGGRVTVPDEALFDLELEHG